jgi:hypothetical protein
MPARRLCARSENGGKQRFAETGTAVANYSTSKSGVPSAAKATRNGWGGARSRRDRTSDALTLQQAEKLIAAAHRAIGLGLPLNRHITIHWERAGVADADAAAATARFLKLAGDWLAKRGQRFAWVWSRENGGTKGSHVHILAHVPAGGEIGGLQRRWLRRATSSPYRKGTIHTARVGGTASAWRTAPAVYRDNLAVVLGYALKGTETAAAAKLGLPKQEPGGRIRGKRCARSQNLGPDAFA